MPCRLFIGGGWGDHINWFDKPNRVYGHKDPHKYNLNDSLLMELIGNEVKVYLVSNVNWQSDPRDMFFADTVYIGTIPVRGGWRHGEDHWILEELLNLQEKINEEFNKSHGWWYKLFNSPITIPYPHIDPKNY